MSQEHWEEGHLFQHRRGIIKGPQGEKMFERSILSQSWWHTSVMASLTVKRPVKKTLYLVSYRKTMYQKTMKGGEWREVMRRRGRLFLSS